MLGAEAPKPPSSVGKGPAEVLGRSPPAGAFAVRLPPPPPPGSARVTTEAPLPKPFLHSLFFLQALQGEAPASVCPREAKE